MSRVSIVAPRLDSKPWGGRRLSHFGLELPDGPIGEALVTAGDAVVTRGVGAGRTLDEIVREDPSATAGDLGLVAVGDKPIFPLLVKLIDASENLSIQVHPDDAAARSIGKLGKTEAWYVLTADAEAGIYVGLADDVPLDAFRSRAARLDGSSVGMMRFLKAVPGETVLIPAGTIHALGSGVMVYEIQQPSDVTYRLDDWGRLDADGNPREMHLEAGFAVARPELRPTSIASVRLDDQSAAIDLLVACRYFALARLDLDAGMASDVGWPSSAAVVTLLAGAATIGAERLMAGQSAVVWAGERAQLAAAEPVTVLVAWVPDIEQDVVRPALAAGATVDDVRGLAGDLPDITIGQAGF